MQKNRLTNNWQDCCYIKRLLIMVATTMIISSILSCSAAWGNTPPASGNKADGTQAEKSDALKLKEILGKTFLYQRENRADPFVPFVSEEKMPEQIKVEEEILTGMQLFEPGQLDLVTILFSGNKSVAMVQDSTGKGHVLKVGQKIGRRGEVKEIIPNVVKIEEWFLTSAGKRRYKTIDMVLRKEGEK